MIRIVTIAAVLLSCSIGYGQDLHFSQTSQTPLFINPAAAGVFDGWERITVNHRNQWLGASTQFMTTGISADMNIGKNRMGDKAHVGLGLLLFNDIGGDSRFGNQNGSLTVSGILPMGGTGHLLSAGVQGGFGQRSADFDELRFYNQFNGADFDPNINSGEPGSGRSFTYIDANAGLFYMYDANQNTFARNNNFKFKLGVAGYHLNKPYLTYSNGLETERLHRKLVAHAEVISDIVGSDFAIDGTVVQTIQGGHYQTILGLMMRYRFQNGGKITMLNQDAYFGFGLYSRIKDAIIPAVMVDWKGFKFGVSYDVTISALRQAYTGGSLEFSLTYRNLHNAIFKTKKRRM